MFKKILNLFEKIYWKMLVYLGNTAILNCKLFIISDFDQDLMKTVL